MKWRWRLAQWIAGQPILPDPTELKDGAAVVIRVGDVLAWYRADTFEAVMETDLQLFADTYENLTTNWSPRTHITFSGTGPA